MQELIERLEKSCGSSPELGRAVLLACGWHKTLVGHYMGPQFYWSSPDHRISFDDDNFHRYDPTASIDVAVTLVPESYVVASFKNGDLDPKYFDVRRSSVWTVMLARDGHRIEMPSEVSEFPGGRSATPATAICIAALKARLSEQLP